MIYIWKKNGKAYVHTDLEGAKQLDGLTTQPTKTLKDDVFYRDYDGLARVIDGELVLGKTEQEVKDEKASEIRRIRDRKIEEIQWRIQRYTEQKAIGTTTDSEANYKKILQYVQDLRDVPEQEGFPETVVWPELKV